VKIKHTNWFAAGPEVQRALLFLSDGAFKLYFYLCVNASRSTGLISVRYVDLAYSLGKSRRSIATYFSELRCNGVCRIRSALNQHDCGEVELCDEFWPYDKGNAVQVPCDTERYLIQLRSLLTARACIRCNFSATDRNYAEKLKARSIPLSQIERAVALGCSRKYVSLLNGTDRGLILSFAYFKDLIEEAGAEDTPSGYWDYLMPQLKRLETKWIAKEKSAGATNASAKSKEAKKTR
jgi:hypothetical protein